MRFKVVEKRENFLHGIAGYSAMKYQNMVYNTMRKVNREYRGGYWEFIEFTNGAKAMVMTFPSDKTMVQIPPQQNYFEGTMSLYALSLALNMVACSHISFVTNKEVQEHLSQNFQRLQEAVSEIPEYRTVMSFLD